METLKDKEIDITYKIGNTTILSKGYELDIVKEKILLFEKLLKQKHKYCEECNIISRTYDIFVLCDKCIKNNNYQLNNWELVKKFKEIFGNFKEDL